MEPRNIETRAELIQFIADLVRDHDSDGESWKNRDISSYLEAMAAWLEDCDGYYKSVGPSRDVDVAHWQLFADAVAAARVYE